MMDSYYGDGYDMVHQHGQTLWSCGYKYESPNYKAVASVSHDAGSSWTRHELYSGSSYGYVRAIAVDPSDPDRVFCLGYENSVYKVYSTGNGGASWNEISVSGYSGTPYGLAVCPTNGNLLAAASSGGFYASYDAGATWSRVTYDFGGVNDLVESSLFNGLLVATVDGGVWLWEGWTGSPVQVGSDLGHPDVACMAESEEFLYAGTDGGAAWRSYNGTGVAGGQEPGPALHLGVYPNPATDFATLSVTLPAEQNASLEVYDLAGRLAVTAARGTMDRGDSAFTLDTSSLSPGIYFVRLTSEGESAVARMVVTR